jgi:negative regulator of flagellin synthesis FlgM
VKIDNSIKVTGGSGANSGRAVGKPAAGESKTAPVDSADVQLSALSAQMQTIGSGLTSTGGVVDAAQVAEIKQAIADGKFTVNPEVIADRLLESVKELISATRQ